jgi:hypothetical protein
MRSYTPRTNPTLAGAAAFRLAQQRAAQVLDNYAIRGSYVVGLDGEE